MAYKETSVKFNVPTATTLLDKKNQKYVDGKNKTRMLILIIGYVSKNNYCMAYTNTSSNASIMFKLVDINFCSIIHLIVYH